MEAQTTPRSEGRSRLTRPAPAAGLLATLEPYNPYILPLDRTVKGWTAWTLWTLGLSLAATLLWDRGQYIATSKGGFMKAPAQWVSALALTVVAVVGAFALGAPWGALPLVAAVVICLRRILAAEGRVLTLDPALAGAARKIALALAGIAAWGASVAVADWLDETLNQVTQGPVLRMGGESAAQTVSNLSSAGERLIDWGSIACIGMVIVAVLWWARDAYLAQMERARNEGVRS